MLSGWRGRLLLWIVFAVVHLWLAFLVWDGPIQPFNDVTVIYRGWVEDGLQAGEWVGFQLPFVYPPLALLPMVVAAAGGTSVTAYGWIWLALVAILDAIAILVLTQTGTSERRRGGIVAAWWWLAFLLLLGPIAVGRLEAVTAPLAIIGGRLLLDRPAVASAILAAAAWIKIWPAAIIAAAFVALRRRLAVLIAAIAASAVVIAVDLVLGGGEELFSFLFGQQERGLQVESLLAGPWLVAAALGARDAHVVWNAGINTFEITGQGTEVASALSTPLLAVLAMAVLALGVLAVAWRRRAPLDVLVPLATATVAVFVVTNKVGSPQFSAWAAAPIVLAILVGGGVNVRSRVRIPAIVGLGLALLTQLVYPFWYDGVLAAQLPAVLVLELKNALWLVLLVWGVVRLARLLQVGGGRVRADEDAVLDRLHP